MKRGEEEEEKEDVSISAITPFPVPLFHISKEHFFYIVNTYLYVCAVYTSSKTIS